MESGPSMTIGKNRPKDTKFHQQKLPAWTPILTVRNAFPYFLVIGIVFIPLGVFFLITSQNVNEVVVPYTQCTDVNGNLCSEIIRGSNFGYGFCNCIVNFNITQNMPGPVYVYYGLTNFYQNHRRYVRSRDDVQLNGQQVTKPNSACDPYTYNSNKTVYLPCGAVAASLFNDTIGLSYVPTAGTTPVLVPLSGQNIAWPTDKSIKFGRLTATTTANTVKPDSWPVSALQRNQLAFNGDEDFLVWMRTAALPNFRKLYRTLNMQGQFANGLPAGNYQLNIGYAYPVTQFDGTKRVIISQTSWLGGRNLTLGITYIVVGIVHILLGIAFAIIHCYLIGRKHWR